MGLAMEKALGPSAQPVRVLTVLAIEIALRIRTCDGVNTDDHKPQSVVTVCWHVSSSITHTPQNLSELSELPNVSSSWSLSDLSKAIEIAG